MSRNSKARRDARRKQQVWRPIRRLGRPLQPHAQLLEDDGGAVGGAGLRDGEWVLVLGSQVVTSTDSAAMMLAMLKHTVAVQEQAGRRLRLDCSPVLLTAASSEAAAEGKTLGDYLAQLEAERLARAV